jgi:hypothetical protein
MGETTMLKILTLGASSLLGIALLGVIPPATTGAPDRPEPKPKKKGPGGAAGDLRKAYDLLRRLRADHRSLGRPEERLRDWTERATRYYRDGVRAFEDGEVREAHEYGAMAHDLARAVDHARSASLYEGRDTDLPPPPDEGTAGDDSRLRFDLRRAYDRIRDGLERNGVADSRFYLDAARDLYNASRRDAAAGRNERAGELARAAEAITHVPEHLGHLADADGAPPPPPKKKAKARAKGKRERPEPKRPPRPFDDEVPPAPRDSDFQGELPPPL